MQEYDYIYSYKGKDYPVKVLHRRSRTLKYTFKDGMFYIYAPVFFVTKRYMMQGLDKYAERLIKADTKSLARGNDFIYLLGTKITLKEQGEIAFSDGAIIKYKDQTDLDKKLKKWFLKIVEPRVRYYESIMGIDKPYKVHVKNMTSRYGSNSSHTHSLSFSTILMHYTLDVLDSVIVHELAHDKQRNHSKKFYDVVYEYCPNYKALHLRLKKGIFHE